MTGGECGGNYAAHWRTEPLKNEHYFGFGITPWYLLPCLEEGLPRSRARCSPCSRNTSVVMPKAASPVPAAQSQTSQEPTALGLVEINTRVTHPRVFSPKCWDNTTQGLCWPGYFPSPAVPAPAFGISPGPGCGERPLSPRSPEVEHGPGCFLLLCATVLRISLRSCRGWRCQ